MSTDLATRKRLQTSHEVQAVALDVLQAAVEAGSPAVAVEDARVVLATVDDPSARRVCLAVALLARSGDRHKLRTTIWNWRLRLGMQEATGGRVRR